MTEQGAGGISHPYRTLVPVLPLELVLSETGALAASANLLRSRDAIGAYMYLPALPGVLDEQAVACLFRPALVSHELLAEPPRRVAQLQNEGRRHLKVKLAAYWGRVAVDRTELPLTERGEEDLRAKAGYRVAMTTRPNRWRTGEPPPSELPYEQGRSAIRSSPVTCKRNRPAGGSVTPGGSPRHPGSSSSQSLRWRVRVSASKMICSTS